jgi:hypothetical protein
MRDDELDAMLLAITAVQPEPRLADRVLRAIEEQPGPEHEHQTGARRVTAVAALATAAVLVLGIGLAWRAARPVAEPTVTRPPAMIVGRAVEATPWQAASALDHAWDGDSAAPASQRFVVAVPEDEPWPNRLPALHRSAPLAIHAIEREAIRHEEIGVGPLSIAQLEIESLER